MLLSACGPQQVVADSGCAWVRPLTLNDEEILVFAANIGTLRPLADQINSQNATRAEKCG